MAQSLHMFNSMRDRSLTRNIREHFPIHIIAAHENMCKYL